MAKAELRLRATADEPPSLKLRQNLPAIARSDAGLVAPKRGARRRMCPFLAVRCLNK